MELQLSFEGITTKNQKNIKLLFGLAKDLQQIHGDNFYHHQKRLSHLQNTISFAVVSLPVYFYNDHVLRIVAISS